MLDVMKSIRHSALESGAHVLKSEREFPIGESTPRTNKSSLLLVLGSNVYLIIAGETIYEREDFTFGIVIDNLVDERGRKFVFGTSFVNIPIINTYTNTATFLVNQDMIRNPFCKSHQINKAGFEFFFNFELYSSRFAWVNWTKTLLDRFSSEVGLNLMYNNSRVNTEHLFITPGEDVTKFFEHRRIGDDFVGRTQNSNVNIFNNPRFYGYVNGNRRCYLSSLQKTHRVKLWEPSK
jgi:hypothetical protein